MKKLIVCAALLSVFATTGTAQAAKKTDLDKCVAKLQKIGTKGVARIEAVVERLSPKILCRLEHDEFERAQRLIDKGVQRVSDRSTAAGAKLDDTLAACIEKIDLGSTEENQRATQVLEQQARVERTRLRRALQAAQSALLNIGAD